MLGRMRDEEFEPEEPQQDTEITLGPAMILAIACGLVLLCALFFGLGYRAGKRNATPRAPIATQTSTGQTLTAPTEGALSKPGASGSMPAAVPQPVTASAPMQSMEGSGSSQPNPLTSYAPTNENPVVNAATTSAPAPASNPSSVRPALPNQPTAAPPGVTGASSGAAGGSSFMVQVAAVSHAEDANVLMNALRKRGYAVSARRVLTDNLIHVQVGPFGSRAEANGMSQRLLGDGYNAQVIP